MNDKIYQYEAMNEGLRLNINAFCEKRFIFLVGKQNAESGSCFIALYIDEMIFSCKGVFSMFK